MEIDVGALLGRVQREIVGRSYSAANELRTASLLVLRGQRSGRTYRVPSTRRTYTASAPGEPPAVRTGALRLSWRAQTRVEPAGSTFRALPGIESVIPYARLLEAGTDRMKKRPYAEPIKRLAWPKIQSIFERPYL